MSMHSLSPVQCNVMTFDSLLAHSTPVLPSPERCRSTSAQRSCRRGLEGALVEDSSRLYATVSLLSD